MYRSANPELRQLVHQRLTVHKREGASYGVLTVGGALYLTYRRFPAAQPRIAGGVALLTFGYFIGGQLLMTLRQTQVFKELGVIEQDTKLEERRLEISKNCGHV